MRIGRNSELDAPVAETNLGDDRHLAIQYRFDGRYLVPRPDHLTELNQRVTPGHVAPPVGMIETKVCSSVTSARIAFSFDSMSAAISTDERWSTLKLALGFLMSRFTETTEPPAS